MVSMYAEYIKEREGKQIIEDEKGFATFMIKGTECYIADIFIKKEFRNAGAGSNYADQISIIARENGCEVLTGSVTPSFRGASVSMQAQLKYGFEISSAHEDFILLKKEL